VLYKVETFQVSPFQHSKVFLIKMKESIFWCNVKCTWRFRMTSYD
jgi:hypothetical protein